MTRALRRAGGGGVLTRELRAADWDQVAALEAATYRELGLSEGLAALRSRAGDGTSFVLETGGAVVGYVLALPYPYGQFPDLAEAGPMPPQRSDVDRLDLHLHDMAVAAERRGGGLGRRLTRHLLGAARRRGYRRVSLVALAGRDTFWAGQGFHPEPSVPPPAGYGPGATYMSRLL